MTHLSTFQVPEVVWAKIRGYPWWPALLTNVTHSAGEEPLYKVDFFGDTTHAMLALDKISKFEESYTVNEAVGRSSKRLVKCIEMAERYLEDKGVTLNLTKKPNKPRLQNSTRKSPSISMNSNPEELPSSEPQHKEAQLRRHASMKQNVESDKSPSPPKRQPAKRKLVQSKISESEESNNHEGEYVVPLEKKAPPLQKQPSKADSTKLKRSECKVEKVQEVVAHEQLPMKRVLSTPLPQSSSLLERLSLKINQKESAEKKDRREKYRDLIEEVKKYAQGPQQVMEYLNSMDINTENIKEILDCEVVDILHLVPGSEELLSRMRTILLERYFADEQIQKDDKETKKGKKVGKKVNESTRESSTQQVQQRLRDRFFKLTKSESVKEAVKLQQLIFSKDSSCGEVYRQHLDVLLQQLEMKQYPVSEVEVIIDALAYIKESF